MHIESMRKYPGQLWHQIFASKSMREKREFYMGLCSYSISQHKRFKSIADSSRKMADRLLEKWNETRGPKKKLSTSELLKEIELITS